MKKLLLSLFTLTVFLFSASAQEDPAKLLKTAKKALSSYSLDPSGNAAKLVEAKSSIEAALKSDVNNTYEAWLTMGNIYAELSSKDEANRLIRPNEKPLNPDAPFKAYTGFKTAFSKAVKKYEKSDALKGLKENLNRLRNAGADDYAAKNFKNAYESFEGVVASNELLKAAAEKDILDDKAVNTYRYYAAIGAQAAGMNAEAETAYKSVIGKGSEDEAACYSGLYAVLNAQKKDAEALTILEEGVKKHPNATDLLFAQINYYLRENKLDILIDKLKSAIEKEPGNTALYTTLGSVYDNLSGIEAGKGNTAKAKEYSDNALGVFKSILEKNPKDFDANYSIGASFYNKAASYTEKLNKLNDDYSDAGVKKYEALKAEMNGVFKDALPYFKKAEAANPNDRNTLIALKEILTRLNLMDESLQIKTRMENVEKGGKNADSFYKN